MDLVLAVFGLVVISPWLLVIGVAVAFFLGTPVLFRQQRPGRGGCLFTLFKFRTMTDTRGPDGELLPDGKRLTAFGRFLRATSLDELPELINVVRGEMSLVGPRPLLVRYWPYFTEEEMVRFSVPPGITGLSQVQGRNDLSWDMRIRKDMDYVACCSLALDLKILFLTPWRVFRRDGLKVDPGAAMLDFDEERRQARRATGQEAPLGGD
ncbi:MAG: sugar transferase [Deltaproteobacteria bacterium]|nr:sugar transferase [Deltaproteobacteria bacterium]